MGGRWVAGEADLSLTMLWVEDSTDGDRERDLSFTIGLSSGPARRSLRIGMMRQGHVCPIPGSLLEQPSEVARSVLVTVDLVFSVLLPSLRFLVEIDRLHNPLVK